MKYPFKTKRAQLQSVFAEKLQINTIAIENKSDVSDSINMLLNFTELEHVLTPSNCSYNFLNNDVSFQLEQKESKKDEFFDAVKKFTNFLNS